MKFSVCWIVKNEADNIVRSIESVKGLADEMIVVDTGSADDTVKLSEEAGARVEYFEWINDFSAARNYALSLVTGDVIIHLDADEWFCEKLTKKDGKEIQGFFSKNPETIAISSPMDHLNKRGEVKETKEGIRIFRGNSGLHFSGSVHEEPRQNGHGFKAVYAGGRWRLNHVGYTEDVMGAKASRNSELLEEALRSEKDTGKKYLYHAYLVREYYTEGKNNEALENLKIVLEKPDILREHCSTRGHSFVLYHILGLSVKVRDSVSRQEIRQKIVAVFKNDLKKYPGTATIDLYYQALFDPDEAALLEGIESAIRAAEETCGRADKMYKSVEHILYNKAAFAAFRRGDLLNAMEYAVLHFKSSPLAWSPLTLRVLLNCIKGQPAADIVMFLNSLFDVSDPEILEFLFKGTHMHGLRDVHAYYLNKRIQAERATKGDYLYLMLLYGKYEEAVDIARTFTGAADAEAVAQTVTMAAVCSGSEKIFRENRELTGKYGDILEAWFSKKPVEDIMAIVQTTLVLMDIYPLIAFAAGVERADEFSSAFSAGTEMTFLYRLSMEYCVNNGLYEYAFSKEVPDKSTHTDLSLAIEASVLAGRLEEAFLMTKRIFASGYVDETLLVYLAVISEKASDMLKTEACELYEKYKAVYDKRIDLNDIVNTDYIADAPNHKRAKEFKNFTFDNFKELLGTDTPRINGMKEICRGAAKTFQEKSMLAEAVDCLILALTNCPDGDAARAEIYENIAGLLRKLGNKALAKELAEGI